MIDTGIDSSLPNLCKYGHKSFDVMAPNPLADENGHGTHVAGLINSNAGLGNYCLVSIKYYNVRASGATNLDRIMRAIQYAINIKVDFINISAGGPDPDPRELRVIKDALKHHITMVVAAGNEGHNLDESCNYFPACYDPNLVVVGNLEVRTDYNSTETDRSPSSNFGNKVTRWEIGTNVASAAPGGGVVYKTGTSQATAVATGKLIKERMRR